MHFNLHVCLSKTESEDEGQKIKDKKVCWSFLLKVINSYADWITRQLMGKKFCNFYLTFPKNRRIISNGIASFLKLQSGNNVL